jgi:hypothetical protein
MLRAKESAEDDFTTETQKTPNITEEYGNLVQIAKRRRHLQIWSPVLELELLKNGRQYRACQGPWPQRTRVRIFTYCKAQVLY